MIGSFGKLWLATAMVIAKHASGIAADFSSKPVEREIVLDRYEHLWKVQRYAIPNFDKGGTIETCLTEGAREVVAFDPGWVRKLVQIHRKQISGKTKTTLFMTKAMNEKGKLQIAISVRIYYSRNAFKESGNTEIWIPTEDGILLKKRAEKWVTISF